MIDSIVNNALMVREKSNFFNCNSIIDYTFLKEWRNVRTLLTDELFELMLKEEGYTLEEFAYSLQESTELVENPDWYNKFLFILESYDYNSINYDAGINVLTLPFSKYSLDCFKTKVSELKTIKVDEGIFDKLILHQSDELFNLIGKVMALKLAEYKESTESYNTDSHNNGVFYGFLKNMLHSKKSFLSFFEEYPVIARMLTMRTQFFIENIGDFLCNLDKDIFNLKDLFELPEYTESSKRSKFYLTDLKLSAGDSHEKGKSVIIFELNHKQKVVYKPKNLEIEEKISELLDWFNSEELLDINLPKGLYRDNYTYNEFVDRKPCYSIDEVQKFYIRFGYLIALCYILGIDDLHLENIVANGEYPTIIDIETAFHLSPRISPDNIFNTILQELEHDSIKGSCLLPRKMPVGMDGTIELSALLGRGGETKSMVSTPININSDDFRYSDKNVYFSPGNNIPIYNGKEVDSKEFVFKIVEGFEDFFEFVLKNKEELLRRIEQFKNTKVRILLKGTEKYASMLRYSSHPNYGKKMKYRERLFMNIWAYPYMDKRVVKSEVCDLLIGDIPVFYNRIGSRYLIDSRGNMYDNYFKESGLDKYQKLISGLSHKMVNRQKNILLMELGLYDEYMKLKKDNKHLTLEKAKINYVREAKKIATYFINNTIMYRDTASMINLDCDGEFHWSFKPMDESFYNGLSGLALFFLELYNATNEATYYDYYEIYIRTAIIQTRNTTFQSPFFGWLSPMYTLLQEYRYNSTIVDKDYFEFTIDKLNALTLEDISKIEKTDYISGISGVITLMYQINLIYPLKISSSIFELFYHIFLERLSDDKLKEAYGLAHGISGLTIATALKEELEDLTQNLLKLESQKMPTPSDQFKWCLGLSGVIQCRLALYRISPTLFYENDLHTLFEKFEQSIQLGSVNDDSLCHGRAGVIITLYLIYEYTGEDKWNDLMMRQLSELQLNSLFDSYSLPKIGESYSLGLFDGMAGIGWMYLFLANKCSNMMMLGL